MLTLNFDVPLDLKEETFRLDPLVPRAIDVEAVGIVVKIFLTVPVAFQGTVEVSIVDSGSSS